MPPTQTQFAAAQLQQQQAAHDVASQVRLIAGPGTGKSWTIGERVCWLLQQGVSPDSIFAVSFTRASKRDLEEGIIKYCRRHGVAGADDIKVSTLHALALGALRRAGLLARYPVDPLVLGDGELKQFDEEVGAALTVSRPRAAEIRRDHEAYWQTGNFNPPNYAAPNPPISNRERTAFEPLWRERTGLYACVLPGEIVRTCLEEAQAGTFDPVQILGMRHLIVDEYQDLNLCDIEFIDWIAAQGVTLFVAGDDDQSIYSFRFASPQGIQGFTVRYPNASSHNLDQCFRCTPAVLNPALSLIQVHAPGNRIPKALSSVYVASVPMVQGMARGWRFNSGTVEAQAIAASCRDLIAAGVAAEEIFILISNRDVQQRVLVDALDGVGVSVDHGNSGFAGTPEGLFLLAILRVVCNRDDYVAHRTILGSLRGIGPTTCNRIAVACTQANLNFRDVLYNALPPQAFGTREATALNLAGMVCRTLYLWDSLDTLNQRLGDITNILAQHCPPAMTGWQALVASSPGQTTLEELRDFLWANSEEERYNVVTAIEDRLGLQATAPAVTGRVRLMTMHSAKGLSAKVVFIPGLEEDVLPGPRRRRSPGLVQEAARLLYVSITRARVACVASYAVSRIVNGQHARQVASQFNASLGIRFTHVNTGLQPGDVQNITQDIGNL